MKTDKSAIVRAIREFGRGKIAEDAARQVILSDPAHHRIVSHAEVAALIDEVMKESGL